MDTRLSGAVQQISMFPSQKRPVLTRFHPRCIEFLSDWVANIPIKKELRSPSSLGHIKSFSIIFAGKQRQRIRKTTFDYGTQRHSGCEEGSGIRLNWAFLCVPFKVIHILFDYNSLFQARALATIDKVLEKVKLLDEVKGKWHAASNKNDGTSNNISESAPATITGTSNLLAIIPFASTQMNMGQFTPAMGMLWLIFQWRIHQQCLGTFP